MTAARAHERQGYPATVMVPKASTISYSAGRRAGDRARPRATYPSRGSPRSVAATAPLTDSNRIVSIGDGGLAGLSRSRNPVKLCQTCVVSRTEDTTIRGCGPRISRRGDREETAQPSQFTESSRLSPAA